MKRFGNAEEGVGAATLLASEAAPFMTGSVVIVDGGFLTRGQSMTLMSSARKGSLSCNQGVGAKVRYILSRGGDGS
jgi:hypothetical protein